VTVYRFSAKHCDYAEPAKAKAAKALLGGKGAALVDMAQQGFNVPPGFTIPTSACLGYLSAADTPSLQAKLLDDVMVEVCDAMSWLSEQFGYVPLVSVRSGAPVSCPGMMDTILNVGLTEDNQDFWNTKIGGRATSDSFRRLVQMLGSTAYGVNPKAFDTVLAAAKKKYKAVADTDLTEAQLDYVVKRQVAEFKAATGEDFPTNNATVQLRAAIAAVFNSWNNPRAIEYRKLNKLPYEMGTAVTVQAMVFGNMGDDSGSGVLFTRDPSTGEKKVMGEYLANAQGEDVVAGIRTPLKLHEVPGMIVVNGETFAQKWLGELETVVQKLEASYRDMVDVEFTVQKGELFILQSRSGKRAARAAFKIAVDMVAEGVITKAEALARITGEQYKVVKRKAVDPAFSVKPNAIGIPACPGVAVGRPVFSAEEAVAASDPVILVTHETTPDDIAGMAKAVGVLTKTGGATSHAAVVARAMDKVCVVGCGDALNIEALKKNVAHLKGRITIDGGSGNVWYAVDVPVIDNSAAPEIQVVTAWCFEALGACEAATIVSDDVKPHRIMAARWWGAEEVLHAAIDDLAALPSRHHVSLDLTAPREFVPSSDSPLARAFGVEEADEFRALAVQTLINAKAKLKGLRIVNAGPLEAMLKNAGFNVGPDGVQAIPAALPADFAAFTVLSR